MNMNAKRQTKSFMENMKNYDMSDGGEYAMLMAVSDVVDLLSVDKLAHSDVPNRYKDLAAAGKFAKGRDMIFNKVLGMTPRTVKEKSLAIQSLV